MGRSSFDPSQSHWVFKLKMLLTVFSACIEISKNNWDCFVLKNVENCKTKFQRFKKLKGFKILISLKICKDPYDVV